METLSTFITEIMTAPYFYQVGVPVLSLLIILPLTITAYIRHKRTPGGPHEMPTITQLIEREIYILNKRIDETTDDELIRKLSRKIYNLENRLESLQRYRLEDSQPLPWKWTAVWLGVLAVGVGTLVAYFNLIF